MLKKYIPALLLVTFLGFSLATLGCDSEGPAEKAGKKVDKTVEDTKDAMSDMADKVTGEGPAEKAGEKIDAAAEKVKKSVDSKD